MSTIPSSGSLSFPVSQRASYTAPGRKWKWFQKLNHMFQAYVFEGWFARRQIENFYKVFGGHIFFQTMRVAVELDLFSLLRHHSGLTCTEIAKRLNVAEQPTRIMLLGLVSSKLLRKRGERYYNTLVSQELLTKESPRNVISYVRLQHHVMYRGMPHFLEAMKSYGHESPCNAGLQAFPGDEPTLYQRLAHDKQLHIVFQDAMSELSKQTNRFLAENIELDHTRFLVDIGGGQGTNILALASTNPHLKAAVFDLPSVAETANEQLTRTPYADRLSAIAGNCFQDPLPDGADAFLMSHFCTIWSAEKNKLLFRKCFDALPSGGKLFIFNMMQNDDQTGPLSAAVGSPYFLTIATGEGMLYTWKEYEGWMREAGFSRVKRVRLPHDHGVIMAEKV